MVMMASLTLMLLNRPIYLIDILHILFTVDNGISPLVKSSQKGQLNDVSFTPGKICNVLKKLKTKFSSGPDGVPSVFF